MSSTVLWSAVSSDSLMCCLHECHLGLNKTLLFWFELTNLALARGLESNLPKDPNKDAHLRSCLTLSSCSLDPPVWDLYASFLNDLWMINSSFSLSLVVCSWMCLIIWHLQLYLMCSFDKFIRTSHFLFSKRYQDISNQPECSLGKDT